MKIFQINVLEKVWQESLKEGTISCGHLNQMEHICNPLMQLRNWVQRINLQRAGFSLMQKLCIMNYA